MKTGEKCTCRYIASQNHMIIIVNSEGSYVVIFIPVAGQLATCKGLSTLICSHNAIAIAIY